MKSIRGQSVGQTIGPRGTGLRGAATKSDCRAVCLLGVFFPARLDFHARTFSEGPARCLSLSSFRETYLEGGNHA